jgi:hypothetical protein
VLDYFVSEFLLTCYADSTACFVSGTCLAFRHGQIESQRNIQDKWPQLDIRVGLGK